MLFTKILEVAREGQHAVVADSRKVQAQDIFVAVSGTQDDGAAYIASAVEAGAAYVVCTKDMAAKHAPLFPQCTFVEHDSPRTALWMLASAYYKTENIWQDMRVIGVTGTNGKTTTAYVLEHVFSSLGFAVGVMGTVSYRWPGFEQVAPLTTPDSLTVHALLSQMYAAGVRVAIMEVSSHALEQERVGGVHFSGAIFSNLTQDHLDYHQDMQNYFEAKAVLFTQAPKSAKAFAINIDDAYGRQLVARMQHVSGSEEGADTGYSFALKDGAAPCRAAKHIQGEICAMSTKGLHLKMRCFSAADGQGGHEVEEQSWELHSPLVGAFNASNLLAVQSLALAMGVTVPELQCLSTFGGVCGRLERVDNAKGLDVFVDYAHTPDALVNVLQALQGAGFTKIITVFGCGGNRDRSKRPLMGAAVAKLSQVAVLTSDNPRREDPEAILQDVLPGLEGDGQNAVEIHVQVDRRTATKLALELLVQASAAGENAAVLIAGKGHEDYQIIGDVKHPYSDQKNVQELVQCM